MIEMSSHNPLATNSRLRCLPPRCRGTQWHGAGVEDRAGGRVLGRPNGAGFQLHSCFQLFDVATVLAYAIGFIIVVLAIEHLLFEPWERYATRWRR